ncbi:hypothetical protein GCM10017779_07310 [Streptomyces capillispiralis]|uniref:Uncharacterized protein n=3 Tax=Streptomyces capillispiralis TaxID=68182 RepID=A0A561TDW6_9ACTN|nr:hypothetical protein FHX78_112266 [Streptomyces capillispiralis]GHH90274.1 hypothetical protein GCM10017779_07310 [Streptomyces capillispiralis]
MTVVSMETTRMEALTAMLGVLGLFVFMVLPAVIGLVRERRIDRQIRRAEAARAAAEHHGRPAATAGRSRPAQGAAPHRTARAA